MAFFGDRNTGANSVNTPPANNKAVSKFNLNRAGSVDHLAIAFSSTSAVAKSKAVIYDTTGVGGLPGAKLAEGSEVVGTTASAAKALPFASPVSLAAGDYWIGIISDTSNTSACVALTGGIKFNADTYSDGATDPFGAAPSSANFVYPINAVFTPTLTAGTYLGELLGGDTRTTLAAGTTTVLTVTAPSAGVITAITFFVDKAYGSAKVKGVVYDNTGTAGAPGALLGTSTELVGLAINENVVTFATPVHIAAGVHYVGIIADTATLTYSRSVANSLYGVGGVYASGPPDPFGTGAQGSNLPALWASFVADANIDATVAGQTIPAFTQSATLTATEKASAAQTIPAFTQAATLTELEQIAAAQAIPDFSQTATLGGAAAIDGEQIIPAFAQTATMTGLAKISAGQQIPDFTGSDTLELGALPCGIYPRWRRLPKR